MSLSDVRHQARAQDMLQRAFSRDRVPHAYIFHGPGGVGKETLARGLAQLLLCDTPNDRAIEGVDADEIGIPNVRSGCDRCESCRLTVAGTHPDVHSIYRQLAREHPRPEVRKRTAREIGVDVIRHFLVDKAHLTPLRGKAKVFLVREADRITQQAQNALLKTLEEPPGTTYLILLSASIERLLPTTLSRCQLIEFDALPTTFVRERIAALNPELPAEQVEWYARNAGGSLGDAVEAVHRDRFALATKVVRTLTGLTETNAAVVAKEWTDGAESATRAFIREDPDITETEAKRIGLKIVFRMGADFYADALRARTGQYDGLTPADHRIGQSGIADQLSYDALVDRINRLALAEQQLDRNVHVQLCVESLLSELACGVPA